MGSHYHGRLDFVFCRTRRVSRPNSCCIASSHHLHTNVFLGLCDDCYLQRPVLHGRHWDIWGRDMVIVLYQGTLHNFGCLRWMWVRRSIHELLRELCIWCRRRCNSLVSSSSRIPETRPSSEQILARAEPHASLIASLRTLKHTTARALRTL